jgi:hypothetical protein
MKNKEGREKGNRVGRINLAKERSFYLGKILIANIKFQ